MSALDATNSGADPKPAAPAGPAGPPVMAPLTGMKLAVTSVALALGTFMQVLDGTIANVSVPTISGDLGVSTSQGTWVITAFAVANGVSVPLTGWLMGRYGVVTTFLSSVTLFTIASFLCGISWNLESLIAFRILQGAVSGPMIPGSQALLIMIFPPKQRGTALAIWSMTTLVAPVCGPILGGYISDNFAWEWIFLINVPIGAACVFFCWQGMKGRDTPTRKLPIDTIGFMLLLIWVGAIQVMFDTGKENDWFSSPAICVELVVAIVGFFAWLIWELTEKNPIVDLSLLKNRNFLIGGGVFCLGFAVFFGNGLLLPLWLQTRVGYVATWAGLVAAPSGVIAVLLTPLMAGVLNKIDARYVASFAMACFGISFWMRSELTPDANFGAYVMPMLVQGVAMSVFFISMVTILLNGIPGQQVPAATGLSNFVRITAGSFAASLVTTLQDQGAATHGTRLVEAVNSTNPQMVSTLNGLQGAGLSSQQAMGAVGRQFENQAYLLATLDLFRLSAWACFIVIPLIWLTKSARAGGAPVAAD